MQDARFDPSAELIDALAREPGVSRELLLEWNNPTAARSVPRPIHELFEEQVARAPDAVALVFESKQLTYAELNTRANRVAHRLHRLGVRPEECVGILVERSPEMVIGLLGILKAGGAYVPLDPRTPRDRLLFMIDEARASIVLTHNALAGQLPGFAGTLIRLDVAEDELAAESEDNLSLAASPDNLMGLLYTSGSTGKPKATMITGRGFLNLCLCYQRYYPFTSQSRALLMMNFSFDAAFKNIVVPLLAGGSLVLANPGYYDGAVLLRAIDDHRVTFINTTPGQIYPIIELAAAGDYRSLSSLECLLVGGEAMSLPKFRQWLNQTGHRCRLVNVYGPAECSDVVSLYEVPKDGIDTLQIVPAGRAIDTAHMYVLDDNLNLLPEGVPGELCVSGELLSRGYWRRPDITAEKFGPNPFGAGDRIYRTGDRARWRADGQIEILGRMTEGQVKLRGIRIELGEIESALQRHASQLEAVVVAHEDESKEKQLVAYIVPRETQSAPSYGELRDFLRQTLPEYMVPAYFVMLESLPMNRNGKVDRKALPPPPSLRPPLDNAFAPPRNVFEQEIALIWEEVLNVQPVGVFDNFFQLGGYSLLAAQLFMRIERLVGRTLPLELLTQYPTIDQMAARLRREGYGINRQELHDSVTEYGWESHEVAEGTVFRCTCLRSRDGIALSAYTGGNPVGPAVVLVNALGIPALIWLPLAKRLAAPFRFLTWESRWVPNADGTFDPERCAIGHHVEDLISLLDANCVEAAHIIGWCNGAQVALKFASLHPERSLSLVIANGAFNLPQSVPRTHYEKTVRASMSEIATSMRSAELFHRLITGSRPEFDGEADPGQRAGQTFSLPACVNPALRNIINAPFRTPELLYRYAHMISQSFREPEHAWTIGITAPTMIIASSNDQIASVEAAREIAGRIKGAQLVILEGDNHHGIYDDAGIQNIILHFLENGTNAD